MNNSAEIEVSQEAKNLYEYLKKYHFGKEKGIKKTDLAEKIGITDRELRKLTREINTSPEFQKLISTSHSCYVCKTKKECEKAIRTTYRVAISHFKKAKQMERKVGLNGQLKIKFGPELSDFVNTFTSEE